MSVKSDEKELQAQARKRKIKAILGEAKPKATPKAEPQADSQAPTYDDDDAPLNWSPDEEQANQAKREEARRARRQQEADEQAAQAERAANPYSIRLQPWERLSVNKRWAVQYRPLTHAEHEAVQGAAFLKKQFDADQEHREKIRRFQAEEKAEQEAARKRAEHEARTGRRPYDPGRYCSVDEAIRRGYVGHEPSEQRGDDWSSAGNPQGIMGGGGRR